MTWVIIACLVVVAVLLVLLIIKVKKISELELIQQNLVQENASQATQIVTLQSDIEKLKKTLEEVKKIETAKETKKRTSRKTAPPAGDSAARVDRLNSDELQDN